MINFRIKGLALVEILVVVVLVSILSAVGVVAYNGYISTAQDRASLSNFNQIVKTMKNEFANCRINPSAQAFNNHSCSSNSEPNVAGISNYFKSTNLKNPYNESNDVVGQNLCNKGEVVITSSNISGSYQVQYVSQKKDLKYTKIVESKWSSESTSEMSKEESYKCTSQNTFTASASSAPKQTIFNYKPPHSGSGAGIIVDENGNMLAGQGAHSCGPNCFDGSMPTWYTYDANGNKVYPGKPGSKYRWVMTEGASASGNIASSCNGGNCRYNFADNTYTIINSGQTFKAGDSIDTRTPINP
tara:strand:- start:460 stop:1362 length:903 start_codon:yes stop_codon:yes gene_type:complete